MFPTTLRGKYYYYHHCMEKGTENCSADVCNLPRVTQAASKMAELELSSLGPAISP